MGESKTDFRIQFLGVRWRVKGWWPIPGCVGNRLLLNETGTRTTTVFDNANQIRYSAAAAGRTTYTFDTNGNQQIVCDPASARTTTTWNYENQPTLFRMPDGSRVTMTYNANKRRIDKE